MTDTPEKKKVREKVQALRDLIREAEIRGIELGQMKEDLKRLCNDIDVDFAP